VTALVVMGAVVVLYGWNSVFLAPRSRAKAAVQKDLAAAQKQEQDLRQNLSQLRRLAADTQGRETELTRLGRLVPTDPDVAGAILALNDTANQAHVAWSSFVPSPPAPAAGGAVSIGISMKVAGTFDQIYDYLGRLATLDRLVVVDSLQLTGSSGTTGAPQLETDVKARIFAAGPARPAAATAVAAGGAATSPAGSTALPKAGG
jgi:Tfp pilus assembly protein PilO